MSPSWLLAAAIAVLGPGLALPAIYSEAQANETAITCVNPASGATWQIRIDYDKSTVDSSSARITDTAVSWRATDGGNYMLDRKSGELTAIIASSTGGYFLHDRCALGK
jgi:hypothetical protein